MTDDATPHSGSRWEPGASGTGDETARLDALPPVPPAAGRTPLRRRVPLAVAALAVAVVGGLGGFAIGQAAAGDHDSTAGVNLPQDGRPPLPDGDHRFGDRFGPGGDDGSRPQGPSDGTGTDGT